MSAEGGKYTISLSTDHKPNAEAEHKRIVEAGGKIYQTQTVAKVPGYNPGEHPNSPHTNAPQQEQIIVGPFRVLPGRLSVSRTFGDIEAKLPKFGGNPRVIIAEPEIKAFKIKDNYDFILLACKFIVTNSER